MEMYREIWCSIVETYREEWEKVKYDIEILEFGTEQQSFFIWVIEKEKWTAHFLLGLLEGGTLKCNLVNTVHQPRISPAAYYWNSSRKMSFSVLSPPLVTCFHSVKKSQWNCIWKCCHFTVCHRIFASSLQKELVPRTVPAGWCDHLVTLLENLNIQQYKLKYVCCPVLQLFCILSNFFFLFFFLFCFKVVLKLSLSFCSIGCHFVFWAKCISLCSPKMGSSSGLCYSLWNCDAQAAQVFHILLISISMGICAICMGT